jgi:hypothetical protein
LPIWLLLIQFRRKLSILRCSCEECSDGTASDCTSCDTRYILSDNTCVEEVDCPLTCESCEFNSKVCTECISGFVLTSDSECLGCYEGAYSENGKCFDCNNSCMTCTGSSSTECLSCKSGTFLFESECLDECETGYFANSDTNECEECSAECLECMGDADQCTSCVNSDGYLVISLTASTEYFYCWESCDDGEIYDETSQTCEECAENCLECEDSITCGKCQDGYYLLDGE